MEWTINVSNFFKINDRYDLEFGIIVITILIKELDEAFICFVFTVPELGIVFFPEPHYFNVLKDLKPLSNT